MAEHLDIIESLRKELAEERDETMWRFWRDKAADLATTNAVLRQIISDAAQAIGNGAFIAPTCSIEFMSGLPKEIRLHIASITTKGRADG